MRPLHNGKEPVSNDVQLEDRIETILRNNSTSGAAAIVPQHVDDPDAQLRAHIRAIIIEELQRAMREQHQQSQDPIDNSPSVEEEKFEWFVTYQLCVLKGLLADVVLRKFKFRRA